MSLQTNPLRSAGRGMLAASLGLALILPQPALAANGTAVWQECSDTGAVSTNHSQADFNEALSDPPADGAEYSPCVALIKAAQQKASLKGSGGDTGGGGTPGAGSSGSSGGGGTAAPAPSTGASAAPSTSTQAVPPAELQKALTAKGINPAAPAGVAAPAPAPAVIGGEKIDLESDRLPSVANTLSLPLPLAASAIVVMFSAALPAIRYGVARFGAPPTGTTPQP